MARSLDAVAGNRVGPRQAKERHRDRDEQNVEHRAPSRWTTGARRDPTPRFTTPPPAARSAGIVAPPPIANPENSGGGFSRNAMHPASGRSPAVPYSNSKRGGSCALPPTLILPRKGGKVATSAASFPLCGGKSGWGELLLQYPQPRFRLAVKQAHRTAAQTVLKAAVVERGKSNYESPIAPRRVTPNRAKVVCLPDRHQARARSAKRRPRSLLLASSLFLATAFIGWWAWSNGAEGRAIQELETTRRDAIFTDTLRAFRDLCGEGPRSDAFASYCQNQADLLLRFPECDRTCRSLTAGHARQPTR